MSKPRGLDHFIEYFKKFSEDFVLIGGSGLALIFEESGLDFRSTKDLDIVLMTNTSQEMNSTIALYVKEGGYNKHEATTEGPKYFRFSNPSNTEFPHILEFFASNETEIPLEGDQYIIPVSKDTEGQISAILLDHEYFEIIKTTSIELDKGIRTLNSLGQICLKARAYREIEERKEAGYLDKMKKHRNDIIRCSELLTANDKVQLNGMPQQDVEKVLNEIESNLDDRALKQILNHGNTKLADLVSTLRAAFPKL